VAVAMLISGAKQFERSTSISATELAINSSHSKSPCSELTADPERLGDLIIIKPSLSQIHKTIAGRQHSARQPIGFIFEFFRIVAEEQKAILEFINTAWLMLQFEVSPFMHNCVGLSYCRPSVVDDNDSAITFFDRNRIPTIGVRDGQLGKV
jgi:hypothetical protein